MTQQVSLQESTQSQRLLIETLCVALFTLLLYGGTLNHVISVARDSMGYLLDIQQRSSHSELLYHPHHLLYLKASAVWLDFCHLLRVPLADLQLVELLNALFGAGVAAVWYRLLRLRLQMNFWLALGGTLSIIFSYGIWLYATVIEVYMIPLFGMLLVLYWLSAEEISPKQMLLSAAALAFAVLFYQPNILLAPVILLYFWYRNRSNATRISWKWILLSSSLAGVLIALPYILVMKCLHHFETVSQMWKWLTEYSQTNPHLFQEISLRTAFKSVVGLLRSLLGGHFAFVLMKGTDALQWMNAQFFIYDKVFIGRFVAMWFSVVLSVFTGMFLIRVMVPLFQLGKRIRQAQSVERNVLVFAVIWLLVFGLFFMTVDPTNPEHWLPQLLCVWLLVQVGFSIWFRSNSKKHFVIGCLVSNAVLLGIINFSGSIYWLMDERNDYYAAKSEPIIRLAQPDDFVVTLSGWVLTEFIHTKVDVPIYSISDQIIVSTDDDLSTEVTALTARVRETLSCGRKVIVTRDAVKITEKIVNEFGSASRNFESVWREYQDRWEIQPTEIDTLYIIQPALVAADSEFIN